VLRRSRGGERENRGADIAVSAHAAVCGGRGRAGGALLLALLPACAVAFEPPGAVRALRAAAERGGPMSRQPVLFVCHGGGPMPLMGQQPEYLTQFKGLPAALPEAPKAVVLLCPPAPRQRRACVRKPRKFSAMYPMPLASDCLEDPPPGAAGGSGPLSSLSPVL